MGASDSDADKINYKSIFIARLLENGEQRYRKAINSNDNSSNNSNNNNIKSIDGTFNRKGYTADNQSEILYCR